MDRFKLFKRNKNTKETSNRSCRSQPKLNWKHQWSIDESRNALSQSVFQKLPIEVLLEIFRCLSVYELGQISLVCRWFKMTADRDEIWKLKSNISSKLISKSFKEIYMDWMYEKYLRNEELHKVEAMYHEEMGHVACGMRCPPPSYPSRESGKVHFQPIKAFKVHPNTSQDMIITLSVDVENMAREMISLMKKASVFQNQWRELSVIKQMITRYYRFMQLKATHPDNILLVPTLDIEMIWQTHLLRPSMYRDDCLRLFHRVIDHSLITQEVEQYLKEQAFHDTCRLYEQRFGESYCPFTNSIEKNETAPKYIHPLFGSLKCLIPIHSYWDQTHVTFSSKPSADRDENPFSFTEADVILDGNWLHLCQRFMMDARSNIGIDRGYHYNSTSDAIDLGRGSIKRLTKSYERFLYMAAKYPPKDGYSFIHPTYAIDIIWHSHMQEPLKYAADCDRLIGYLIDHTPWPSVDEKKMKNCCDDTSRIWKNEFQVEMSLDHLFNTDREYIDPWND